jgi:hypothetical protein
MNSIDTDGNRGGRGNRAQVVLLDGAGVVAFGDSGGFRETAARRLASVVGRLA